MVSLRVNLLKADLQTVVNYLEDKEFRVKPVDWCPYALIVENATVKDLTNLNAYDAGLFYIQNLSSLLPVIELNPQPGEIILDLAAAPGGKTSHMAMLMHNQGQIYANDLSRERLYKMKASMDKLGVTNITYLNLPGQKLWQKFPAFFDKALVDVPCSMQDYSKARIKALIPRQRYLLRSAISATKPGGIIVYSTCTSSQEENENNIAWILQKEQGRVELVSQRRVDQDELMTTFFVAKLRLLG